MMRFKRQYPSYHIGYCYELFHIMIEVFHRNDIYSIDTIEKVLKKSSLKNSLSSHITLHERGLVITFRERGGFNS